MDIKKLVTVEAEEELDPHCQRPEAIQDSCPEGLWRPAEVTNPPPKEQISREDYELAGQEIRQIVSSATPMRVPVQLHWPPADEMHSRTGYQSSREPWIQNQQGPAGIWPLDTPSTVLAPNWQLKQAEADIVARLRDEGPPVVKDVVLPPSYGNIQDSSPTTRLPMIRLAEASHHGSEKRHRLESSTYILFSGLTWPHPTVAEATPRHVSDESRAVAQSLLGLGTESSLRGAHNSTSDRSAPRRVGGVLTLRDLMNSPSSKAESANSTPVPKQGSASVGSSASPKRLE